MKVINLAALLCAVVLTTAELVLIDYGAQPHAAHEQVVPASALAARG